MICTSVVPCLSSGLAKNNKIMSMFVQLFRLFLPFLRFGFFSKMVRQTLHQSSQTGCFSQFLKGTTLNITIFQKSAAILTTK